SYPSCLLNLSSLRELSLSNLYATKPFRSILLTRLIFIIIIKKEDLIGIKQPKTIQLLTKP
ncbi:hypothetical protein ABTM55_16805, partial [Acinetobacter baumannii]|uniref:hypothetical protein n=1 Tax=Acinetobacter baumannii TaxID=470 RepID=UPI00331BD111